MGHPNRHFDDRLKKYILIGVGVIEGIEARRLLAAGHTCEIDNSTAQSCEIERSTAQSCAVGGSD